MAARRTVTGVLSVLLVIIGMAMLVRTIDRGGGGLASGVVLGVLFVALGALRLYATVRGGRR